MFLSLSEKDTESMEYRLFECVWYLTVLIHDSQTNKKKKKKKKAK